MTKLIVMAVALLAMFCRSPAWAADGPADLPPADVVVRVLEGHPSVRVAEAEVRAAEAAAAQLKAGGYEFGVNLSGQRRDTAAGPAYNEWELGIERGLRLPGKARLDARIGEQGLLAARERVADARHEAARQLLTLWYGARKSREEAALWRDQAALLAKQKSFVETRVKRGDAARLDLLQMESATAQAEAQVESAEARERLALVELQAAFPELPIPGDARALPSVPEGEVALWQTRATEHSHELAVVERERDMANFLAERARADRVPDPTLGLRIASEQGGDDRIVGIGLSMPIPGTARSARAAELLARADARAEQVAATRRRLSAGIEAAWRSAVAGVAAWQRQEEVARLASAQAELATRANGLGEFSLPDTLIARRAAIEAKLAAGQSRLSANEAIARLMLDAHALWPLEPEGHEAASGVPVH